MANVWLVLVKKHTKAVAAEKAAGKFKGKVMAEAIKREKLSTISLRVKPKPKTKLKKKTKKPRKLN